MLLFPNAKINIGLNIIERRSDGFHNLETIFYPVPLQDGLELHELKNNQKEKTEFVNTGRIVDCPRPDNLCIKAYNLLDAEYRLPPVRIHLHKNIPFGGGLGGGSSDAAFTLIGLNNLFHLNISNARLKSYAEKLGSDCPFFIENKPCFGSGKGEILENIDLDLTDYYIFLVKPDIDIPTRQAFQGIIPRKSATNLKDIRSLPIHQWNKYISNDFEAGIFEKYPAIAAIKSKLYEAGAEYASMTGSGATVYGIFKQKPIQLKFETQYFTFMHKFEQQI